MTVTHISTLVNVKKAVEDVYVDQNIQGPTVTGKKLFLCLPNEGEGVILFIFQLLSVPLSP